MQAVVFVEAYRLEFVYGFVGVVVHGHIVQLAAGRNPYLLPGTFGKAEDKHSGIIVVGLQVVNVESLASCSPQQSSAVGQTLVYVLVAYSEI